MKDLIVIGAGCAGLTAALYAARAGKSVLILEAEGIGGQITAAPAVENYPGVPVMSGMEFADRLYEQVTKLGVETELTTVQRIEDGKDHKTAITEDGNFEAKAIILATGAKHRHLDVPGEEKFSGHGVSYCAMCDGAFFKGRPVAVIGGGNTALTDALYLAATCSSVVIIHRREEFRADADLVARAKKLPNIQWVLNSVVEEFLGTANLSSIRVYNKVTEKRDEIPADAAFIAIGQEPSNAAFASLAVTDAEGYFVAGEDGTTKTSGIYVAGDCRAKALHQLTTAAADGANAAMSAWKIG